MNVGEKPILPHPRGAQSSGAPKKQILITQFGLCLVAMSLLIQTAANVSNAAPPEAGKGARTFSHFESLKPGSIQPNGWIKSYAQVIADGWPLLYAKEKPSTVYGHYWDRLKTVSNYMDGEVCYAAYFGDDLIHLAHLLPQSQLAKELDPWLKLLFASQDKDGYLGELDPPARWHQWLDMNSQGYILEALLFHYRATGDRAVLDACERSAARIIKAFHEDEKEVTHAIFGSVGTYIIPAMRSLYALTGKQQYLDFAKEEAAQFSNVEWYLGYESNKSLDVTLNTHSVIMAWQIGHPAMLYEITGEEKYLKASLAAWQMMQPHVNVDGQPTGHEFIVRKAQPRSIGEHCTAVSWPITSFELARIAGEVKFADAAERAVFNAYPGSKSPDTMCLAYMHSPNQLVATEWSHPHYDDYEGEVSREFYSSAHNPLCCNAISPRLMAYFAENMVLRSADGLAMVCYGPSRVRTTLPGAGAVELVVDTQYPFEDDVRVTINPEKESAFPMEFRIPGWCSSASLELNGKPIDLKAEPGKYALVRQAWHRGDVVRLHMEVPIRLEKYAGISIREEGCAVVRGPLVFALPVQEKWDRFEFLSGPGKTVSHYRVIPQDGSAWNCALMVDQKNLAASFTLKKMPVNAEAVPWTKPVVCLEVNARRVLNWEMEGTKDHPMTPALPFKPMKLSDKIEKIDLIPFGCTRLRMSYLPLTDR